MIKIIVIICFSFASASFMSANILECQVSSNPENNIGHCRNFSEGKDICYPSGEGPECYGNTFPSRE